MSFIKRLLQQNKKEPVDAASYDDEYDDEYDEYCDDDYGEWMDIEDDAEESAPYIPVHARRAEPRAYEPPTEARPYSSLVPQTRRSRRAAHFAAAPDPAPSEPPITRRRRADRWKDCAAEPFEGESPEEPYEDAPYDDTEESHNKEEPFDGFDAGDSEPFDETEASTETRDAARPRQMRITRGCKLEKLDFSTRTFNALMRGGVRTVGMLLDADRQQIRRFKHVGATAFAEIEQVIEEIETQNGRFALVDVPEGSDAPWEGAFDSEMGDDEAPQSLDADLDVPISELGLTVRATNALLNAKILSTRALIAKDRNALLSMRNMGAKSAEEVLERIEEIRETQQMRDRRRGKRRAYPG